ncbi:uncharacterized protein LOC125662399 isoform X1 [Ostrea edulis]|uniref:uncharacterized protein LOC125662399 isoform X1 n=1 Tax=Ostrea edulis TaxID=37623 RepID=UPI0024AF7CBA|nr:uncharacterized protein LOC125662399 isoform X1 [Ostrea edulis]XP_056002425.1 uncharacterized protein LOC125662399 isoform X1 [Ostrea edulis]XP_056002426.1 uncharacterized protein LOC125662399 isoform X1 [Ostrea edulis]XP_056002427.1 uncharacterized protein LOC125662399 isoform X1 [Ostrea edulis]XP_056002428.1 uncharacterized protein LOC125662399 isoform X1 [Ostrea edulis]XP_056002429.1 uncharacterized protein LOC125662399 isoform X1 [Ostrea edulis]
MLLSKKVFQHHLRHHLGTFPLVLVVGLGTTLAVSYPLYCLYTSPDIRLWKRQRRPRYEDVDITKSKTVWTITPLLKRTGPVSEMESLAHQAVGRHEYQYGEERDQ